MPSQKIRLVTREEEQERSLLILKFLGWGTKAFLFAISIAILLTPFGLNIMLGGGIAAFIAFFILFATASLTSNKSLKRYIYATNGFMYGALGILLSAEFFWAIVNIGTRDFISVFVIIMILILVILCFWRAYKGLRRNIRIFEKYSMTKILALVLICIAVVSIYILWNNIPTFFKAAQALPAEMNAAISQQSKIRAICNYRCNGSIAPEIKQEINLVYCNCNDKPLAFILSGLDIYYNQLKETGSIDFSSYNPPMKLPDNVKPPIQ